ncbi:MAG: indole-3-glycerol phosphate synthase TrpC [Peptococcaceae bacterium]
MILREIIAHKKTEVAQRKKEFPLLDRKPQGKGQERLKKVLAQPGIALIAEVKKASPSKGVFLTDFDPVKIACCYERAGAGAVSVLTESKYFQGSGDYLLKIKERVKIPILRKDFIIDPYQIYETGLLGADALLLIAGILEEEELHDFLLLARSLGLDALVEVHCRAELEKAVRCGGEIIGINNRDLQTFQTDLNTTRELARLIPSHCLVVSESGISTAQDVRELARIGVNGILVGEALVTSTDLESKIKELLGGEQVGLD